MAASESNRKSRIFPLTEIEEAGPKRKRLVCCGILLLGAVQLRAAVAYPGGYVRGGLLAVESPCAFLSISASRADGTPANTLVAVDFADRQVLWEAAAPGGAIELVQLHGGRLVTIEGDCLVARMAGSGTRLWETDLRRISTGRGDMLPVEAGSLDPRSAAMRSICNRCVSDPESAERFDYAFMLPDPDRLLLFRVAETGYDGPESKRRDFLRIDLATGQPEGKGCYRLLGLSEREALLSDCWRLYRLDGKDVAAIPGSEKLAAEWDRPFFHVVMVPTPDSRPEWEAERDLKVVTSLDPGNGPRVLALPDPGLYFPSQRIVSVGDFLVRWVDGYLTGGKQDPEAEVFRTESFDLQGNRLNSMEERTGRRLRPELLKRTRDNRLIVKKGPRILSYSTPDFRLTASFTIPDRDLEWSYPLNRGLTAAESRNGLVIGYVKGNLWMAEGTMADRREARTLEFRFFSFSDGKEIWSFKRKVTFSRINRRH